MKSAQLPEDDLLTPAHAINPNAPDDLPAGPAGGGGGGGPGGSGKKGKRAKSAPPRRWTPASCSASLSRPPTGSTPVTLTNGNERDRLPPFFTLGNPLYHTHTPKSMLSFTLFISFAC